MSSKEHGGKKSFSQISPEETFAKMFAVREEPQTSPEPSEPVMPARPSAASIPKKRSAGEPASSVHHTDTPTTGSTGIVAKRVYLTHDLADALRRRVYLDPSKNASAHVRAALRVYLADDLAAIRELTRRD